jgi:serine/threonine protein kinase
MLNLEEDQIFDSQYQLLRLVDTGGFTEVWEAKYLVAGNTVALKVYPKLDEDGIRNIEQEYKRLFELQHSNLLNVLHFGRFNGYPYLVMRYYPGGNASRKIGSCSQQEIAKCLSQIGGVLKYLHANSIIHQDIKPNNFLLDQYGNYYLADLGLSLKVRDTIRMFTQTKTTDGAEIASIQSGITPPPYRAPELYDRQRGNKDPLKATDIWALGASLFEMITGEPPFGDLGGLMQMNDPRPADLPASYSRDLDRIIKSCLEKDPLKRPTAAELEKKACYFVDNGQWEEKKKAVGNSSPLLIAAVTILLMVTGVYAIQHIIRPSPIINGKDTTLLAHNNDMPHVDSPLIHPIRVFKPEGNLKKVVDSITLAPTPSSGRSIATRTKEPTGFNSIDYPVVNNKPHSNCAPTISRIVRNGNATRVTFYIGQCAGTVSLFPPGSEGAFYIRTGGRFYDLEAIEPEGQGMTVPSGGLYFTATFPSLDESIREIDIMEGKNQLDRTMSYFNFKGVQLTK